MSPPIITSLHRSQTLVQSALPLHSTGLNFMNANSIYSINFNQDSTCLSVGTKDGYKIFNCDPFGKCFSNCKYLPHIADRPVLNAASY